MHGLELVSLQLYGKILDYPHLHIDRSNSFPYYRKSAVEKQCAGNTDDTVYDKGVRGANSVSK